MMEEMRFSFTPGLALKCTVFGICITACGMLLQIVVKRILLGVGAPPTLAFVIGVSVVYFCLGFLFALGFLVFCGHMPGKTRLAKATTYAAIVSLAVIFGNIVGAIGLDFKGRSDLFTTNKIETYITALIDFANFMISASYLAALFGKERLIGAPRKLGKGEVILSAAVGAVVFPLSGYVVLRLLFMAFPGVLIIPPESEAWFHFGTWAPLVLTTGVFLPVFSLYTLPRMKGSLLLASVKLIVVGFLLYWVFLALFVVPFGYGIGLAVLFFGAVLPPIFLVTLITGAISRAFLTFALPVHKMPQTSRESRPTTAPEI